MNMCKVQKISAWLVVGLIVWATGVTAVPLAIPYQGVLSEVVNGSVVPMTAKSVNLEVRLYNAPIGGTALWGRQVPVTLDNGAFNLELNDGVGSPLVSGTTLESVISSATDILYIGLKVVGSEEITPRQRLLSAAYAIAAPGVIPIGGIIMWSGAEDQIPTGWALCSGQTVNGIMTPDLRGRFVVGAGSGSGYTVGNTGGVNEVTLNEDQMPKHSHLYSTVVQAASGGAMAENPVMSAYQSMTETMTAGGNQPHENRPPYYALCYIMRVK